MVEVQMVKGMVRKGLLLSPVLIAALFFWGGATYAISAAVGLAMALGNLWLSAAIIGGVAQRNPQMLLPAGLASFILGLLVLTGVAAGLQALDVIYFPVTGFTLIGAHLGLVLWEAAAAPRPANARS